MSPIYSVMDWWVNISGKG